MAKKNDAKDLKASKRAADSKKSAKSDAKGKNAKAAKTKDKKKGGIRKYFRDLKSEIKKVVWPTRSKVLNNTGVVLTVIVVVGLFLFGVDSGLSAGIKALLTIGG